MDEGGRVSDTAFFNLIMHGNDEAWESGPRFSMPSERFLEHTEAAIKAEFELADQNAFKVMEGVRSVLMYEIGAPSATRDIVRLGVVKDIRIEGDHLTLLRMAGSPNLPFLPKRPVSRWTSWRSIALIGLLGVVTYLKLCSRR